MNHDSKSVSELFKNLVLHPEAEWNPVGDGIMWNKYDFPVILIMDKDQTEKIRNKLTVDSLGTYSANFK